MMFGTRARQATILLAAGALVLTACGRSSTSSQGGSSTAAAAAAAASTLASGPAAGTITVWAQGAEGDALPAVAKTFEAANPGVTVKITAIPWDAAHNKYQTAIAGGATPDVAQMGTTWMGDFYDAFAPTPSSVDSSVFFRGSVKSTLVKATPYGVPWYVDTRVVFYRKDLAAKAGYTTFPTTWDGFKALAKALQTKAGAKWGVGLPAGGNADDFQSSLPFSWSAGAELMNADQTKWTLDTPAWVDAMTQYQSLFTGGIANKAPNTGAGAQESAFVDGSIPMFVGSPSSLGSVSKAGGGAAYLEKIGVAMIPKDKSATSFVGGSDMVVFKKSANQTTAWKFVQFLSQPAQQAAFYKQTGDLPAVQSAWKDVALAADPKLTVFGEQLKDTNAPPSITTWTQVSAAADSTLEQIIKAGANPADAMKALQATADSIGIGG